MLAILVILLFAITALACYYDCENRRGHLLAAKYGSIKRDTVPTVTIKSEGKQSGVIDKRKIREDVRNLYILVNALKYQLNNKQNNSHYQTYSLL